MKEYPEHEKLRVIKPDSQKIGEFIEWLSEHGYHICERRDSENPDETRKAVELNTDSERTLSMGDAFVSVMNMVADNACVYWPTIKRMPEALLEEFFEINPDKLEDEKRAMLDELRAAHNA